MALIKHSNIPKPPLKQEHIFEQKKTSRLVWCGKIKVKLNGKEELNAKSIKSSPTASPVLFAMEMTPEIITLGFVSNPDFNKAKYGKFWDPVKDFKQEH